jgi:hypothetical protein
MYKAVLAARQSALGREWSKQHGREKSGGEP